MRQLMLLGIMSFLLIGCVSTPQNPEEFKQFVPGFMFGKTDKLTVNSSLDEITATFEEKSRECLNVKVNYRIGPNDSAIIYRSRVERDKSRTQLILQYEYTRAATLNKQAEGGDYYVVVDATPAGGSKTTLDMYWVTHANDILINAIKDWARGKVKGCPDMSKNQFR